MKKSTHINNSWIYSIEIGNSLQKAMLSLHKNYDAGVFRRHLEGITKEQRKMELNERQLALYHYMCREMAHAPFIDKYALMNDLNSYYHRCDENSDIHNSSAYRRLREDIEAINDSSAQYVILSHKINGRLAGYKLATKNEQIAAQALKLQLQGIRMLEKARLLAKKARNNGQVRFANEVETKEIKTEFERR